jgi:cytoskeletal protein RodZ
MKSVGKQLQEARLAKNWTPELAARETKIRVDRLRDLEADDYSHFSSPTYARGFVRTYARSLGLDEYKLLRQLDNKLPEDDNASFANDTGVHYVPEPAKATHAGSGSNAGLYVVMSLGFVVALVISFIMVQAYRAGELQRYFANDSTTEPVATPLRPATNSAPSVATGDATSRALPVDPNAAPPPAVDPTPVPVVTITPVEATTQTNAPSDVTAQAVKALPVDPSELTNAPPAVAANPATPPATNAPAGDVDMKNAPRALPVDLTQVSDATTNSPPIAAAPTPLPTTQAYLPSSARASGSAPAAPVPTPIPVPTPAPATASTAAALAMANIGKNSPLTTPNVPAGTPTPPPPPAAEKRLILTASRDSFVRVTDLEKPDTDQPLFASVLRSGQSVGFSGRKFSINVGVPSAVDITLDGVNYGPHSDQEAPETFSVESHQP